MVHQRRPLVSIMMPAFNAEASIGLACASLVAQDVDDWECVIVDDGSSDGTFDLVSSLSDPRFRIIRHSKNLGRGVARQTALEACRGKYLAMLDADDWWYPGKLREQLLVIEDNREIVVISSGMAVMDDLGNLIATSKLSSAEGVSVGKWTRLRKTPVAFGPSLMRMEFAKSHTFDGALRRSQDFDFLVKVAFGKIWARINRPLYAYKRVASEDFNTIRLAYQYRRRALAKHYALDRLGVIRGIIESRMKELAFAFTNRLQASGKLLQKRYALPSKAESERFLEAKRLVLESNRLLWG